jgi:glycosyltransferase involved in cell wall biosynthesis
MRILLCGHTYQPATNGAAVFMASLAKGLAAAGHQVTVLAPSRRWQPEEIDLGAVRLVGIRSLRLPAISPPVRLALWPGRDTLWAMRRIQPEVVHLFDHYPLSRAALAAAGRLGVPVLGSNFFLPANIMPPHFGLPVGRALLERLLWATVRAVLDRTDLLTTPTESGATILHTQGLRPPVVAISCGVDLERFRFLPALDRAAVRRRYGLEATRPLVLYVGRLDPEKRLDLLLRAVALLPRDALQIALAGRGRQQASLQRLTARLDLDDRVQFIGFVPEEDLMLLLNSADAFVMPGEAELQSLATLEAMACARPIIAANACALPELVREGENGFLYRAGDAFDLAQALQRWLEQRSRWPALGAASLAIAQGHDRRETIRRYEEVYAGLVRRGQ